MDGGDSGGSSGSNPPVPQAIRGTARRGEIEVSGSISTDTEWNADKVKVIGDVVVEDGVTLTIVPGVLVEFQDCYHLSIQGTLLAVGTPERRIRFTTDEPEHFTVDPSEEGCWKGIRFHGTRSTNATSRIEYCIIEYGKAADPEREAHPFGGGAISVYDFSKLVVAHCILRNNVADHGGAIFLYRMASPLIADNLIHDNHALVNASAIYCAYSYPGITGNTLFRNKIHNKENKYIDSCAVDSFIGKPVFANNIIRANDPEYVYSHYQLLHNKAWCTSFNNIEDYAGGLGNIDADPLFADAPGGDFHITFPSPCKDAGDPSAAGGTGLDFEGDPRGAHGAADMGADEFHTHLYVTGDPTPGGSVTVKLVDWPGTKPVGLCLGTGMLDPPLPSIWGGWYLQFPFIGPVDLGAIPHPSGILVLAGTLPDAPPAPYDLFLQALIGDCLTNLCILEVN